MTKQPLARLAKVYSIFKDDLLIQLSNFGVLPGELHSTAIGRLSALFMEFNHLGTVWDTKEQVSQALRVLRLSGQGEVCNQLRQRDIDHLNLDMEVVMQYVRIREKSLNDVTHTTVYQMTGQQQPEYNRLPTTCTYCGYDNHDINNCKGRARDVANRTQDNRNKKQRRQEGKIPYPSHMARRQRRVPR